jgi:hypothetical protein
VVGVVVGVDMWHPTSVPSLSASNPRLRTSTVPSQLALALMYPLMSHVVDAAAPTARWRWFGMSATVSETSLHDARVTIPNVPRPEGELSQWRSKDPSVLLLLLLLPEQSAIKRRSRLFCTLQFVASSVTM